MNSFRFKSWKEISINLILVNREAIKMIESNENSIKEEDTLIPKFILLEALLYKIWLNLYTSQQKIM